MKEIHDKNCYNYDVTDITREKTIAQKMDLENLGIASHINVYYIFDILK